MIPNSQTNLTNSTNSSNPSLSNNLHKIKSHISFEKENTVKVNTTKLDSEVSENCNTISLDILDKEKNKNSITTDIAESEMGDFIKPESVKIEMDKTINSEMLYEIDFSESIKHQNFDITSEKNIDLLDKTFTTEEIFCEKILSPCHSLKSKYSKTSTEKIREQEEEIKRKDELITKLMKDYEVIKEKYKVDK